MTINLIADMCVCKIKKKRIIVMQHNDEVLQQSGLHTHSIISLL
jgi:hypothetical protein